MGPMLQPDPARIDAAWMTAALRAAGVLESARVQAIERTAVGNGLVADSVRFTLHYDRAEAGAPGSVVGKFPASDPASRRSGTDHQLYRREIAFYRELAGTVGIHTPQAHVAEIDPETDDFTLILADLSPARQGDQLGGCTVADCATALAQAAALHAPRWGDPSLLAIDWLAVRPAELIPMVDAALPMIIAAYEDRYRGLLEPRYRAMIALLPAAVARMREDTVSPRTVVHGDFRLDNVMFDVNGGAQPMATLDWQTVGVGIGAVDAAYFLSAALDPEERRQHEVDLVRGYHAALMARGVAGYGWDQCWQDYRRSTLHGIMMGVFSALSVERTDRGDALFLKMTRGACAQAEDHGSFALWGF